MDTAEDEKPPVLEADTVYLLMKKGFPISRNVRAQWVLQHLDTLIFIKDADVYQTEVPELNVISVIPKENNNYSWSPETSHLYLYKVTASTTIHFLAEKYRVVFSLDLSPSLATVDIQNGEIVIDEVLIATKRCLEGITIPFIIPGSKKIINPEIYVTVIVHTPFFTSPAQQVLVQGWLVTMDNVAILMQIIESQLNLLEEKVAQVTSLVNSQLETLRAESERLVGGLFEEGGTSIGKNNTNNNVSTVAMVSPEIGFVNILRYGMLALSLLPEHSCANLVIVSDGIVGVDDVHALDSVIQQLRAATIACSFLHVGSSYHPRSANGLVPYPDLLRFLATATLGSYMTIFPAPVFTEELELNVYHKNLLRWQLYRTEQNEVPMPGPNAWRTKNNLFYGHEPPQLLRKKQIDDQVTCTLNSLLCCRLREGYLLKKTTIRDGSLEICFVLPWKTHVYVEYLATCPRFTKSLSVCNTLQYSITIEAPYEFLHDITCLSKKPLKSQYRQNMVSRFWSALTSLTEGDKMLAHFSWFPSMKWTWYNVPDTIKSGMPLFYMPSPSSNAIQLSDAACPQFGQIWQPVVSLEPHQWPRWLHCQRITLVLIHDRPLSKHLHQANQSGRFQSVQYRQAAAVLYGMLKTWATFVLVENHTYVQFIHREPDKPPISFSLINISCKSLCVVLNVAFAGGSDGQMRHAVMADLMERLSQLTLASRRIEQKEIPCCIIMHKALEKILIRYERMPIDLSTVSYPDGSQIVARNTLVAGGSLTTTLSRYLYHARWLWLLKKPALQTIPAINLPRLNVAAIARILSTVTKIRLAEGFNFAYSAAGIINTVMEVQMQGPGSDHITYPCIVQYISFPPHVVVSPGGLEKDSGSEEETDGTNDGENLEDTESSGDFQIAMEIWIEPQCGQVHSTNAKKASYMHSLEYHQLPDAISKIDKECINALLTLEHLSLMCQVSPQEKSADGPVSQTAQSIVSSLSNNGNNNNNNNNNNSNHVNGLGKTSRRPTYADIASENPLIDDRIRPMQFEFDALGILPKCQQAELLFSMFVDDFSDNGENNANRILMESLLNHIKSIHNRELILSAADSDRFTKMLAARPREEGAKPVSLNNEADRSSKSAVPYPRWRCFVKGISVTHVIVTLIPAAECDVHLMAHPEEEEEDLLEDDEDRQEDLATPVFQQPKDSSEQPNGETSGEASPVQRNRNGTAEISDLYYLKNAMAFSTPKTSESYEKAATPSDGNPRRGLVLPIYVYDCSLALLIDTLIEKLEKPRFKDIYRDHTFKVGEQFNEEFVNLKSGDNTKPSSPEPKSEDSDNVSSDQRNLTEHCKVLSLAHCHSYVVAAYKSLVLQQPLSYDDMDAAVEQCEECLIEINITDYLRAVCKHLETQTCGEESPCSGMRNIHNLIKDKFKKIINVAFKQVPIHPDFYFCLPSWKSEKMIDAAPQVSSDSDDEVRFTFNSDSINGKFNSLKKMNHISTLVWPGSILHERSKVSESSDSDDSFVSDLQMDCDNRMEQPLFLQLNCSIHSKSIFSSTSVKLLPTCFTEITQKLEDYHLKDAAASNFKITLDIICLNLPKDVLEVSIDNTPAGLRTTSYCSEGSMRNVSENSEGTGNFDRLQSFEVEQILETMANLPSHQYAAVSNLVEEINWLLKDETAAVLLDKPSPTEGNLNFVAKHVEESNNRSSCYLDKVPLHFVFSSDSSLPRFIEELNKLTIDRYCIEREGSWFYFVKNSAAQQDTVSERNAGSSPEKNIYAKEFDSYANTTLLFDGDDLPAQPSMRMRKQDSSDPPGCHSEISSIGDNQVGTDDGYEGDSSSDSEEECQWLIDLDHRRELLPNFWLIMRVEKSHVNVYFHCRFLELTSPEVDRYQQIQKIAVSQVKAICRRVNQYLLLRDLHDKRICDPLLEPESIEDHTWKNVDNSVDTSSSTSQNQSNVSAGNSSVAPGMFRCPIVCEVPFCLHHRLKTGPGKTGLSRGIKALQTVLNRFSVNNRSNMFVYQENNGNVFYLRLHERTSDERPLQNSKLSESDEKLMVSRSSSITSLSQAKSLGVSTDQTSTSSISADLRPRVRSFGERESDLLNKSGDSIVLMVHGISEAGPEVKCELVQVLQNRLDDAVLEVLSVMLARNPMCKLTPSDVHFIQRPYRAPESVIRLSVQERYLRHMTAFGYYLRQNILQFLYTPKYTDTRAHSHFQDYSQSDSSSKRVPESDIYLYNQSHSSGSRGIACIAIAIVNEKSDIILTENENVFDPMFSNCPEISEFENIVSTNVFWGQTCSDKSGAAPKAFVEFRIWKQGRVNLEALVQKLKAAVRHSNWDLITEYAFLPTPLTEPLNTDDEYYDNIIQRNDELDSYELGEKGKLSKVYHTILPYWFQFALDLSAPAIKKHVVTLERRHSLPVILKELQNLVQGHALDTTARTFVQCSRQPFLDIGTTQDELLMINKLTENNENSLKWLSKAAEIAEKAGDLQFLSCDTTMDNQGILVGSILLARNFSQWKASFSNKIESEQLIPKDQKLLQKFNPLILEKTFVPRQRLLLAKVQSQHIIVYMYNWSKERSEKLVNQISSLGLWLSSRSNLHSSIVMQKLGIFHHQPTRNYEQEEQRNSQYYAQITDMESLAKFPNTSQSDGKEWQKVSNRGHGKGGILPWNQLVGQVMRDAKPSGQYPPNTTDPVVKTAYDFQELRHKDKKYKDDLNKLHTMWQSRSAAPNIPISVATLNTFKQHSRLIHYCYTPLLFLPSWRLQSAATRDHSLIPPPFHLIPQQQRSRTTSDASNKTNKKIVSEWHKQLCEFMLSEYKQYLQVLGFSTVLIESQQKNEADVVNQAYYLKKSMLGGVLLFEISLAEPFFTVKLRVIECSRLQAKSSSALVNQFMLSFVDACDEVKINMHLHSFTYDFHLRCIHSYIAGNSQWSLKHGYHLTNFLDDFNKYYSKAPNYARNLICSGDVTLSNLITPAHTLYQYLLSHEKAYNMQVFSMTDDPDDTQNSEYVLVKLQSTPLVSYHDAQDTKYTDDFDIALIVTWPDQFAQLDSREITLKYYLMLTSKRELYPKRQVESNNKIGKFRTVYSVVKSMAGSQVDTPSESSPASTISPYLSRQSRSELISCPSDLQTQDSNVAESLGSLKECVELESEETNDDQEPSNMAPTPPPVPDSPLVLNAPSTSAANLTQIRQESINYLGYYSSHEQLMQQLIMSQASAAQQHIRKMIEQGALHCRTHLLWNRLLETRSSLSYAEFSELCALACVEPLSKLDSRLSLLFNQPIAWYQNLAKLLQNKYQEYHKQFNAPDGNVMHHLILHPNYVQAFMMLTIDLHASRGQLFAVYRKSEEIVSTPFTMGDIYSLIEDFVNACCFHLWLGLYS